MSLLLLLSLAFLCIGIAPSELAGAEAEITMAEPPYFAGEPVVIRIAATGFDEEPTPECTPEGTLPKGLRLDFAGMTPQVSESIYTHNGRVQRTRKVNFYFNYQVTTTEPGHYELGPFVVRQGNRQARTESQSLTFQQIEPNNDLFVEVQLPPGPFYLGQRVPVTLRWGYAGDFDRLTGISLHVPLFDQFSYQDREPRRGEHVLRLNTATGPKELAAQAEERQIDGRQYTVLVTKRQLIFDAVGEFSVAAPTLSARIVTRWSRRDPFGDFFGSDMFSRRQAAQTRPLRATGEPLAVTVKPIPQKGRPATFSGAVGQNFTIESSANRTVVRVGDPISLRVTLSGPGDLTGLALPSLTASGSFSTKDFRIPEESPPGIMEARGKQFTATIRVERESVSEIPGVPFSWFDPETERFVTSVSRPIALQVLPGQVVSAKDVVAATPPAANPGSLAAAPEPTGPSAVPREAPGETHAAGADLSIETRTRQLGPRHTFLTRLATRGGYVVGLGGLAWALWVRKKRAIDPAVAHGERLRRDSILRLSEARCQPPRDAARETACVLRQCLKEFDSMPRDDVDSVLAQLESIAFAPSSVRVPAIDPALFDRVTHWIRQSAVVLALGLVTCGASWGDDAAPWIEQGVNAYQQGLATEDRMARQQLFVESTDWFRKAVDHRGPQANASLLVNLGNAAMQSEQMGLAIWAFRSALLQDPSSRKASDNLRAARETIPAWVRMETKSGAVDRWLPWRQRFSRESIQLVAAGVFLAGSGCLAAWLLRRGRPVAWSAMVLVLAWSVLAGSTWFLPDESDRTAVVIVPDVIARSADSPNATARFAEPLPGGTEVAIEASRSDWSRVRLENHESCWLPASSLLPLLRYR